tara:strand:- start:117342 stop:118574 length:1233 start_codon:yes stop_codon:yes gene_type:complete
MNTKNIFSIKKIGALLLVVMFVVPLIFISCDEDNETPSGDPYFTIEENPTGLSVDISGTTKSYVVRSNRSWQIIAQGESDWVKAFPTEGDDDGIFKFIVDPNDSFDTRTINYAFVVDGKEQPTLFRVEQEANVPYITIVDAEEGIGVPSAGGDVSVYVQANVDWTYTLDNDTWLTGVETSGNEIKLLAAKNIGEERSVSLTVSSAQYPDLEKEITITQSAGNIILEENFDWIAYGSTIFYTTSGETRMDSWTTEELARGWTSTENTFSSNQMVVYARTGFVKLGKTGKGGDLISPALSSLEAETNVRVTFKAVPYKTKGGTEDDNTLNVSVIGDGTVSVSSFTIDNWPNYDTDPDCVEVWESDTSTYEFTITGATAGTRIKLLGGDYELVGVGKGKNRIFIDNIKVEIIE